MGNAQKVNQKTKSWEEMTKAEKGRTIGCLGVIGIAILSLVIGFIVSTTKSNAEMEKLTIAGLEPTLSSLALKQMGFSRETNYGGEYGTSWTCTRIDYGITYVVDIYAPEQAEYAQSFRLNITVEPGIEDIQKGLWMMKQLAGVKYDTSDYTKAEKWVEENYNNDKATIVIGDAEFTIHAPSNYVRILNISKFQQSNE